MNIEKFLHGYMVAALWSSHDWSNVKSDENPDGDDNPIPLDENYSVEDIAPETVDSMREDCECFIAANAADLAEYAELRGDPVYCSDGVYSAAECAGHDFWLSRNGHGAGFFDRGSEAVFQRLQDAARVWREIDLYVGGDGKIYS